MNKQVKKIILQLFIIVCLCGTIYYLYKIVTWKKHITDNKRVQEIVSEKINIVPSEDKKETKFEIDFDSLKGINKDTIGYIKVNNTNIDYIVVKGKDNSYYLNHNFERKWNVAGWVFADYHNKFDGSDKNIVIYDHNMKDGSMFGSLSNVLKKEWYTSDENKYITFVSENGTYKYEIFSIYTVDKEDYYINTMFKDNETFNSFINTIKSRSIYNFKVDVSKDNQILTLSSCTKGGKQRVVVHAVLSKDTE